MKKIAIANQKGGVGKTTTTINLAAALATLGKSMLIMDLDPQGNVSTGLGIYPENRKITSYDVLVDGASVISAVMATEIENLRIVTANSDLSSADAALYASSSRMDKLKTALSDPAISSVDYILFDCPPSLNLLTVNALVAADSVLVPLQSEFFALEGLSQLLMTVQEIREAANANLRMEGVVLTMYDARNKLSQQVEQDARENLGDLVFKTKIPRNVRISEAPSHEMSIFEYDPASKGARAYMDLATELLEKG